MKKYRVRIIDEGVASFLNGCSYDTKKEAAEAIRDAHGWDDMVWSFSYTVDDGKDADGQPRYAEAVSVYPTQAECDYDLDGAYAPKIVWAV